MADMIKLMRTMFDDIEHNMNSRYDVNDIKFNEVRSDINELNIKSESNFNEIKQNNVKFEINMNKRLNEIDEYCSTMVKQMQDDVNDIRKRKESKRDTGKRNENNNTEIMENKVIGFDSEDRENISDNHNDDKLSANENINNEGIVDKVSNGVNISDDYNGEIMMNKNNKDVVENGVSKSDTVNNSSDEENIMGVEGSEGVIISVNELEREWKESLSGCWGQRANFPCVVCEEKASQVFLEDVSSSRVSMGDKWSANSPFMFYDVPGKARWCCKNVVLPSAWNEIVK